MRGYLVAVAGLESSDTGEQRAAALDSFNNKNLEVVCNCNVVIVSSCDVFTFEGAFCVLLVNGSRGVNVADA